MAFRWRADDGPRLNSGFVALWFFRGSGPVLLRNPVFLWFFRVVTHPSLWIRVCVLSIGVDEDSDQQLNVYILWMAMPVRFSMTYHTCDMYHFSMTWPRLDSTCCQPPFTEWHIEVYFIRHSNIQLVNDDSAAACSFLILIRPPGEGVCAPMLPKTNAMISPSPWENPQLHESILPLHPKSLKLI